MPAAILAAVDFSAPSRVAARVAARLAQRHRATLTLIHVDRMPEALERTSMQAPADVWDSYLRDRSDWATRLLEELAGTLGGVEAHIAVACGDVARAIVERAAHDGSRLIALGAHGTAAPERSWLGSVPFEVAAHAPCPTLVVRERGAPADERGFRQPLVTVALDRPIDVAMGVTAWLSADDASFHLVHVHAPPSPHRRPALPPAAEMARSGVLAQRASWLEAQAARLRRGPIAVHFDEAESAGESILERIERCGHDLVVVGPRVAGTPSGLLGPVARRLLEYARVSVAVVPAPIAGS